MSTIPWIILLLPLASATIITSLTRRAAGLGAVLSVASAVTSFVLSIILLSVETFDVTPYHWITVGDFHLDIGFTIDGLSQSMMFIVTGIGAAVHLYSLGYMKKDDGKARYFASLSLFMFSMTGIVLANNFAMMFIFWELVGVSSYLLIGHWFERDAAADAAKKAFITNRIGDFGFIVGILLVWGLTGSIFFDEIETAVAALPGGSGGMLTIATLLVFCGAIGKSAQFPLHVWLPDAMEGPTPVSALIHAATMVAAGVYMLARTSFLIKFSDAGPIIAWTGAGTALLAAVTAIQQNDIKRILAYSTLSQLGYMVMAAGVNAPDSAMFHLYTHAFFKALLFLGAGAVIHACHHEQNIWKMGGLRGRMPITAITFAIGTAALIAVPFTSGFWSKECILACALHSHGEHSAAGPALFSVAAIVALLTPFYMTRLFVVAFLGKARDYNARESREVSPIMWVPLVVLALFSLFSSYFSLNLKVPHPETHAPTIVIVVSVATLLIGSFAAWVLYRNRETEPFPIRMIANKFYFDELYARLIRIFQDGTASFARGIDQILIDGIVVCGSADLTAGFGTFLRRLQVGNLQGYVFILGMGVIIRPLSPPFL